jgi:hypothetical protein
LGGFWRNKKGLGSILRWRGFWTKNKRVREYFALERILDKKKKGVMEYFSLERIFDKK